jgi:ABC-type oligopeptide transport system substrate-binding subunit/class 3 adenylate cyclase
MHCSQCDTENPETAKFCSQCGAKLSLACQQCGRGLPLDAKFCLECGAYVAALAVEAADKPGNAIPERIKRLVPADYVARLMQARGQLAGERRLVTILFSDIKGSTAMAERLDPEDVMEIMDGAFDVLIEPIMRYEGTLARLMGDAILAFFGAPIAHEDDPERACRAALEIVEGAQAYAARLEQDRGISGFNVRVGINTGLVVVGEVGSDLRVEYTAMGDAINLAARMEQHAAPGSVLITHDTYRHIRGVFDVQPQEPLLVKGKVEPVQTYVVLQAKPRAFRLPTRGVEGIETRMIGREAELKRLQDALHDAIEDRERQVFTIVGDAGVGKSRLLYEFDSWVELLPQTIRYFKGRARQEMQNVPYALLRDLFAFRFQIQDSDSAELVRQKIVQGVAEVLGTEEQGEIKAHLMGQLMGYDFSDSPHLREVRDDPQALHQQAMAHMAQFFTATSDLSPTLLLLEDLHWSDDSSLDVVNRLAESLPETRLMIVCAARPALFERRPHWGEGQTFHTRLDLTPLSHRDGRRLVAEILQRVDQVPATLRDLIVTGAEGNPFFIEELIKMLMEDAVIVKGDEAWRVEPDRLAKVRVPESLTGVLQARLDRLPLAQRTILQQASVVGRLFWDRAVAHIGETTSEGMGETEVVNGLTALRDREMVFRKETSAFAGAGEYIFKHAVLREITYASVLKRLRKAYHSLVADWLVEEAGERASEMTGLIADHLQAAGRTSEALEQLLHAGDQARGLYAHQEAIVAYRRALALLREQGEDERAARTLMKLGLTYHTAFEYQRSREAYDEAFALWQGAAESEQPASLPAAPHALRMTYWEPLTLDAAKSYDEASGNVIAQLFDGLVEMDLDLNVMPRVARNWEVSEGGRKYVFHLRDDVSWSDGTPVTAGDFAYALRRMLAPETGAYLASLLYFIKGGRAYNKGEISSPDSVRCYALDEWSLVIELEEPTPYSLHLLSLGAPAPRHTIEAYGEAWTEMQHLVTNGPFRLESWAKGTSMDLVRNPEHGGLSRGNVKRIELRFLPLQDWPARLALYAADELDILDITEFPPDALDDTRRRHPGEYTSIPNLATVGIGFNAAQPPFDDPRVRQALAHAIDKEALTDVALGGYGSPANGGFVPPMMPGHAPGIGLVYDVSKGQRLLVEAGYPGGRGLPVLEALLLARPISDRIGMFMQTQWQEHLGVKSLWTGLEYEPLAERMEAGPPHVGPIRWIADYPDPDSFLRVAMSHYLRFTGWQDRAFDAWVEQARRISDQQQRMRAYREADRILIQSAAFVPLFYGRDHLLVKPWIRNHGASMTGRWFWNHVVIEPH